MPPHAAEGASALITSETQKLSHHSGNDYHAGMIEKPRLSTFSTTSRAS
eukprot:CAMPEP_0115051486 /NCGR_PEP_ID=MMETSP0227-20121206/2374_1 /TAXON_ID=89957 /ORGANISM="Polarella glacialis, Strain CCMP 1383" /LENGTH=48 /DNA_ID= /DNA_START= /DNA_END= /DNA_ORIENTATION=